MSALHAIHQTAAECAAQAPLSSAEQALRAALLEAATLAGEQLAPNWPLDQLIAVNPWWEMRDRPFAEVAARLAVLGDVRCLPSPAYARAHWQAQLDAAALEAAAAELEAPLAARQLQDWLHSENAATPLYSISTLLDAQRDLQKQIAWQDEIVHQISQFCADVFSAESSRQTLAPGELYQRWLHTVRADRGLGILMGEPALRHDFDALPEQPAELIAEAGAELLGDSHHAQAYFHHLLLGINGWAAWLAWLRWQAQLDGAQRDLLPDLLAMCLAWDWVLWRHTGCAEPATRRPQAARQLAQRWHQQWAQFDQRLHEQQQHQLSARVWQRAAEQAWQSQLQQQFAAPVPAKAVSAPELQAVFCIDVRSEVYRRALEAQSPQIQTLGFAGFFGLPIAYRPRGAHYQRPQLPALLRHGLEVSEREDTPLAAQRQPSAYDSAARWQSLGRSAPASFGVVEAVGLGYAFKLLRDAFIPPRPCHVLDTEAPAALELRRDGKALSVAETAQLLAGILGAMTLTGPFAPAVLLVGHGSSTRNNPHAAGLDCGACGGQSGALNVRLLAQLLNRFELRAALQEHGITIPTSTHFLPALHDTTTDELRVLESAAQLDESMGKWLAAASEQTRRERAPALGVAADNAARSTLRRASDWAELRPEWALAGNACFVVAPRSRTRHLNFGGRSFLHDYDWRADAVRDYSVLELIMTAPMLVTNWINMQYYASVTDPLHCGSGNKLLHNVVGGNIGVFEGNGGDLRIGLPLQSVHDGTHWMHEPLRLSVYIAAPAEPIAQIAARHEVVSQLIDNDWLYLFRLDEQGGPVRERLYRGAWLAV